MWLRKKKEKKKQTQKQLDFILPIKLATITEGGKKKKKESTAQVQS